ncbi:DNA mismatch repair protein MutL [Gloeomargarita lithophora Alchichica-D10]|uniref:DNA mismatch repair protein MutL n=1 Tax=Gloeomargarita lithophora Alchichica-D10 TaxID=1188229 RepID=A0A1J0ACH4_9CYAN|nr:DNA mismatch repair endonuclease MutL [Gloeomargarita lithophora]APB33638.1 DNA mismatch repair protein MutL [Gloeomargarita lithophora Alchichica-D10]
MTLHRLAPELIERMAAGEVIDSLGAVVRELAENALDAQATHLHLRVQPDAVRLADNGWGMTPEMLTLAATAHTTSKIQHPADFHRIQTLGFRGQALYSVAQLADLTIASRCASAPQGWQVQYDSQGQVRQEKMTPLAPGTVVTVNRLFADWPQRQQGLPSWPQQLRQIQLWIQQMALCHPQVTWQVEFPGKTWHLWPGTVTDRLTQVMPQVADTQLQTGVQEDLTLVFGLPDQHHRPRPDRIWLAVNGRCVELPEISTAILQHFQRLLPRNRFPLLFAHFQIPPAQVDWHRHPAKTQLYLKDLEHWQGQLLHLCDQGLGVTVPSKTDYPRVQKFMQVAETSAPYHTRPTLKALAQIHRTYILAEHPAGLWLVEQHIAHERVLYEQLQSQWQLVSLESPVIITPLSPEQVERLTQYGLAPEPFGPQQWAVRHIPQVLAEQPAAWAAALLELSQFTDREQATVDLACRSAIRNGTALTLTQMQTLLEQWQATRAPRTCPHGRPICLTLGETQLARFFRRHWVIGKSHGI